MSIQEEITHRIRTTHPDATVELTDLTGGGDHWQAVVVSTAFAGMSRIARQRSIYGALGELLHGANAPIHALTLQTLTPDQTE